MKFNHAAGASALLALSMVFAGCSGNTTKASSEASSEISSEVVSSTAVSSEETAGRPDHSIPGGTKYEATLKVSGYDQPIVFTMDEGIAPETVENFVNLAESGFYDGLTFHRIIEGFMIQGGDPRGDGTGGSSHNIHGEFASNGFDNILKHDRGTVSMARSQDPDSASSQFFIMHEDSPSLDGQYAAFGTVTSGMEVVDDIATTAEPTDNNGSIDKENQPVIESITIKQIAE